VSIALRPFHAGDDEALLSWFGSSDELRLFAGDSLRWPLDQRQLQAVRDDPMVTAWTAVEAPSPAVVGHIELSRLRDRGWGRLARVAVAPPQRGLGLGRALVEAALAQARARGLCGVDLRVFAENAAARALYASVGFADVGADRSQPELRWMVMELDGSGDIVERWPPR
jgi:ribosomal protein S18 acetylase RimI-like enzyme